MRKRAALVTAGIAVLAITGISAPAQAAAPGTSVGAPAQAEAWTYIGTYSSRSYCIDAGQQYVREGFNNYRCDAAPGGTGYYKLYVR
ncbi:hypothetical protein OG292_23380 [Streptomyces sp. NBC_01511]|uniref:hypothetical protein n=1 Tax=unclassified Streptomyces TaxID=2593676 RepID=UPI003864CB92